MQLMQFCHDPITTEFCLLNQADVDEVRCDVVAFTNSESLQKLRGKLHCWHSRSTAVTVNVNVSDVWIYR